MSPDSINKKSEVGVTPLDEAYECNGSPIRQEIIALLRLKGGKANRHDEMPVVSLTSPPNRLKALPKLILVLVLASKNILLRIAP